MIMNKGQPRAWLVGELKSFASKARSMQGSGDLTPAFQTIKRGEEGSLEIRTTGHCSNTLKPRRSVSFFPLLR